MFDFQKILGAVDQIDAFIKLVSDRVSTLENKLNDVHAVVQNLSQAVGTLPGHVERTKSDVEELAAGLKTALEHQSAMLESIGAEIFKRGGELNPVNVLEESKSQPGQPTHFEGL